MSNNNCIGPTNIIPNNNQVVLLDNNKSITVIDNNCCTNVDVTQPITSVVQVLTGPIGPTGKFPTSGSIGFTGSFDISGSLTVTGSITANTIYSPYFTGSFNGNGNGIFSGSFTGSFSANLQDITNNGNVTTLPITASSYYGNGLQIVGNAVVTGSLTVSGSNTFRNIGSAQFTGSTDITGSLSINGVDYEFTSASFNTRILNNSSSISSLSGSFLNFSSSYATGSFTGSFTGSLNGTASWAENAQTASYVLNAISSSYALTASYVANASSFPYTGSAIITGSLIVTGSIESTTGLTGSLLGTASYTNQALSSSFALTASYAANVPATASYALQALSSSYALTASYLDNYTPPFPFTGSAIITGSLIVTGSITSTQGFTGSLQGTASYANQALTASYATTSSYLTLLQQQIILSGSLKLDPTQDPDPTGLDLDSTVLFQSSSNTALGYDLYVRQNGNLVKWKWIEGILETGLLYGGVVTYSGSNVFVSPGSGIIAEHNATTGSEVSPMIEYVTWNAITQSVTNIATQQVTYLYIDNTGTLQQQSTRFTSQQYHDYIPLGAVGHFDYIQVSAFGGGVQTAYDQGSQTSNFIDAFGPLKVSGYGLTGQTNSLRLSVGSGISFIHGGFYQNDPEFPSQITTPSQATASLARVQRSGSAIEFDTNAGNLYTVVDPTKYDRDGDGTLANVGSGNWSIQRVFSDPKTGVLYVHYGQARYTSLLNALQFLPTDPFTEGDTFDFTTFVGFLVLKGNASDITDTADNSIINGGLFRGSGQGSGGGIALSNLDDLTDVSITSPVNGQALIYNSGIWQNGNPTSASYSQTALSSSYALTASYASTYAPVFPFTGSAIITGSLEVTGSIRALVTGSDLVNIGNASTTNQRLVRIGQNGAFIDIGSQTDATNNSVIYMNQTTPSGANYALRGFSARTDINSTSGGSVNIQIGAVTYGLISGAGWTFSSPSTGAGVFNQFTFTNAARINQTLGTNIPNFLITGANKQWATGNITNQYWNYLTANTASFVGASTITSSYGLFVEEAAAGTNTTITNNFAAGFSGSIYTSKNIGIQNTSPKDAIHIGVNDGTFTGNIQIPYGNVIGSLIAANTALGAAGANATGYYLPANAQGRSLLVNQSVGASINYRSYSHVFNVTNYVGYATPITEWSTFVVSGSNTAFSIIGTIPIQRFNYFMANTASFNSTYSGSITNLYNMYVEAPVLGTRATGSNIYAAGFSGSVQILTGSLEVTGSIRALVTGSNFVNIGNAVTASQRLVRIGQDTAFVDIGSLVGATSFGALYFNQPTPSSTNFTILANATQTVFNGTTSLTLRVNNGNAVNFTQTSTQFNTVAAASSGAVIPYSFASISNTNQTATTNIPNFQMTGNNKQWATGNITNQYWNYLTANTASFVGASTITSSYGLFVEAATAGTNATITNNYAAGFSGNVNIISGSLGIQRNAAPLDAIHIGNNDGNTQRHIQLSYNCVIGAMTGQSSLGPIGGNALGYYMPVNSSGNSILENKFATGQINYIGYKHSFAINASANRSSEYTPFIITQGQTNFTASVAIQRWTWITSPTAVSTIPNTFSSSYNLYVEAPIMGTNTTSSNNYAAGFIGNVIISGSANISNSITASIISASAFTGSLFGTASYATQALTASYASTYAPVFPFTGSAIITGSLGVTGSIAATGAVTSSTMLVSGSGVSRLTIVGSGSSQPIFTVQGSQGELFSITDSLSGSLFSVNDISGLPIVEVFSDNTTLMGSYLNPMLITTTKVTQTNSGSFVVYSLPTSSYDTAFYEYSIKSGSNGRAGTIMAIQSGSSVNYTEVVTTDFGSTSAITFSVTVSGSNIILSGSSTTGSWTTKCIIRGL
jgi:hypothetical protein